jgi:hypothetical protein
MQGRKDFTPEELDRARTMVGEQMTAYEQLASAVEATGDADAKAALEAFEPLLFNNLTLALDRFFVHRLRGVTGKDGTPLNEVELISDSLITNEGVLRTNNVIKYKPDQSVLALEPGDRIAVRADQFKRLSSAFTEELEEKFV